jgi:hypothetical protein
LILVLKEIVSSLNGERLNALSSFYNTNPQQLLSSHPVVSQEVLAVARKHPAATSGRICEHIITIMSNVTAVEEAIDRVDDFHNRGGGLELLINYKDVNMRDTMVKYKIAMHPHGMDGKADLNQTLYGKQSYEYMQQYMKNTKDPRGGYFTKLPGGDYLNFEKSATNGHHLHLKDKKVHLEEPVSNRRWLVGMGPIGPTCDHLHKFGESYDAKVSFLSSHNAAVQRSANEIVACLDEANNSCATSYLVFLFEGSAGGYKIDNFY